MYRAAVFLCSAVALTQGHPAVRTTCESLGTDLAYNSTEIIGEWQTVYSWPKHFLKYNESVPIRALTDEDKTNYKEQLDQASEFNEQLFVRFIGKSGIISTNVPLILDLDKTGSGAGRLVGELYAIAKEKSLKIKLKQLDEFLVVMLCDSSQIFLLSRGPPDEDRLQRAADDLLVKGVQGGRVQPYYG